MGNNCKPQSLKRVRGGVYSQACMLVCMVGRRRPRGLTPALGVAPFYKDLDASARLTGSPIHLNSRSAGRGFGAGLSSVCIFKRVCLSVWVSVWYYYTSECIPKRVRGGVLKRV
jgi:hypothetical protein